MSDKMVTAARIRRDIAKVDMRITVYAAERQALVDELLSLGWDSGKVQTPNGSFTVAAVNEYPEAAFRALVGDNKFTRCTKRVLDRAKAKSLYPAEWEASKVNKGQKVSFG